MLTIVALQFLGAEMTQTRRAIFRNEDHIALARARREFTDEAAQAIGPATEQEVGNLAILPHSLVIKIGSKSRTLYVWQNGSARLSYSKDGRTWQPEAANAQHVIKRFTWNDGNRSIIWWTP